jgi:hypothetical protein
MMVSNNEHFKYPVLSHNDSIRTLTLAQPDDDGTIRAHVSCVRLRDRPAYSALSYVWGEASHDDPELVVNGQPYKVTRSLHAAISYLASSEKDSKLWIDQISINQEDDPEKIQQVRLMSSIFSQARVVIGWLGLPVKSDQLAFNLFRILGSSTSDSTSGSDQVRSLDGESATAQAIRELTEAGLIQDMEYLFHPDSITGRAAATLCRRPWFRRLWIVQEATLAQVLELRCGTLSISSQQFFAGVEALCSTVSDPPMESLHSQYYNAHRLGQLVREVQSREHHSFPYLAHRLSIWECKKDEDRLNALYGFVFRYDRVIPWFQPSYEMSVPDLYKRFATNHITVTRRLDVLHFAGCVDSDRLNFRTVDGLLGVSVSESRDETPSWAPDWRVRLRPLALTALHGEQHRCPSTSVSTTPDFAIDDLHGRLRVRARQIDRIRYCGLPYCESVCRSFGKNAYQIFCHWYALACAILGATDIADKFASTLTMDCRIDGVGRDYLKISVHELPTLFKHWAARNFPLVDGILQYDSIVGLEESTRFGNLAEELCRNRIFFVTEAGRLGLGNVGVRPGGLIYLIQGLETPSVVDVESSESIFRGTCYVNGLMDVNSIMVDDSVHVALV